jgi:Aminotransferase class-V
MTHTAPPIYLDDASTTPVHPAVLQAMEPTLRQDFGNPSNLYRPGRRAAEALEAARATVAGESLSLEFEMDDLRLQRLRLPRRLAGAFPRAPRDRSQPRARAHRAPPHTRRTHD